MNTFPNRNKQILRPCPNCHKEQHFMRTTCNECRQETHFRDELEQKRKARLEQSYLKAKKRSETRNCVNQIKQKILRQMARLEGSGSACVLLIIGKKPYCRLSYLTYSDVMRSIVEHRNEAGKVEINRPMKVMMEYLKNEYLSRTDGEELPDSEATISDSENAAVREPEVQIIAGTYEENSGEQKDSSESNGEPSPICSASKKLKRNPTGNSVKRDTIKKKTKFIQEKVTRKRKSDGNCVNRETIPATVTASTQRPEVLNDNEDNEESHQSTAPVKEIRAVEHSYATDDTASKVVKVPSKSRPTSSSSKRGVQRNNTVNVQVMKSSKNGAAGHFEALNDQGGTCFVLEPREKEMVVQPTEEGASEFFHYAHVPKEEVQSLSYGQMDYQHALQIPNEAEYIVVLTDDITQ